MKQRNETSILANNGEQPRRFRSAYSAPSIRLFGPVGALTQAGTGLNSEVMSMGMNSMSTMQQRP